MRSQEDDWWTSCPLSGTQTGRVNLTLTGRLTLPVSLPVRVKLTLPTTVDVSQQNLRTHFGVLMTEFQTNFQPSLSFFSRFKQN